MTLPLIRLSENIRRQNNNDDPDNRIEDQYIYPRHNIIKDYWAKNSSAPYSKHSPSSINTKKTGLRLYKYPDFKASKLIKKILKRK